MLPLPSTASALWPLLAVLVVWRLTALLCYERGPFELLTRTRRVLVRVGLEQLVTCFHCAALWMSVVVVTIVFERCALSLFLIIAVAGGASILERFLGSQGNGE